MKAELIKQFIKKTIKRVLIFTMVMIVVSAVMQSIAVPVSNELALTQMQNSNEMFVLMNVYSKLKPIVTVVYSCVILWFVYTLGRDTYKFAKTINTQK